MTNICFILNPAGNLSAYRFHDDVYIFVLMNIYFTLQVFSYTVSNFHRYSLPYLSYAASRPIKSSRCGTLM
ncbi:hypothetical protein ETH98_04105 [Macrococcoides caseolyticum]|nr:hypothetical protein ETH98_04105 [Macrococcus caseolyticus]